MNEKKIWIDPITPLNGDTVDLLDGNFLEFASNYEYGKSENYMPDSYIPDIINRIDDFSPKGITVSWRSTKGASCYILELATNSDFSNTIIYSTTENSLQLCDLYVGTDYYYRITAKYQNETITSQPVLFHTSNLIRTLQIEGVSNTRDIGGYYTEDGKGRLRQGMVYRGEAPDRITEEGKEKALIIYGIKTDLDLRGEVASSAFGDSVKFINTSAPYYVGKETGIFSFADSSRAFWSGNYRDSLLQAIRAFADPENYPIYVHCLIGRDRTGTIVGLISALCGVSEFDLYKDYEASFFSGSCCLGAESPLHHMANYKLMLEYLKRYGKETLAENVEAFLLEIGITQAEIDSIRSIMVEKI